ncbi:hypothetical protein AUEXF2481DRAFT_38711 [Aureobasidium subglaciale EXF-2481]|uniref:Secreted protein n=1 Tax=Aureobasidium subglaciale (strain EXF-2481) TaxID=1043005 RepID=A0A074ZCN8_AURSE|nr:uncharacterized protein AUEXF2481DRAFT_38711 [Aureobasidium subglaciale EXF-2481]KEQ96451.1 hypothetical protein AUEXF2481DRAFT_38711 [Aureobasidium subglaciale EXF-2481]
MDVGSNFLLPMWVAGVIGFDVCRRYAACVSNSKLSAEQLIFKSTEPPMGIHLRTCLDDLSLPLVCHVISLQLLVPRKDRIYKS